MQLNLLVQPVAEAYVVSSLIYLYPASMGDVSDFCGIPDDVAAPEKFRMFLPLVASLSVPKNFREKREPLADELAAAMSAGELEQVASIYIGIPSFDKVRAGNADEGIAPLARLAEEAATSYLDRLVNAEGERQRRLFEKLNVL